MMEYSLGVDIGTSACKAAVFDKFGRCAGSATAEYPVLTPHPGWAEQDPAQWWAKACDAIKAATKGIDATKICAVGAAGQSWAAVLLDNAGNVLTHSPIWLDTRADAETQSICGNSEFEAWFAVSGNVPSPGHTTPKLLWYKNNMPDIYKKTAYVLQSNGYIAYKLTGVISQDMSQGYGHLCYDITSGKYNKQIYSKLEINSDILPPIYSCDDIIGKITDAAAAETGLPAGIPVVAGGLDAACSTLGAGVYLSGQTQEQGGQAGGMSICQDTSHADKSLILSNHVLQGKWLLQGGTTGGGGAARWFHKEFGSASMAELDAAADKIPPGSGGVIFLPYMSGERSPIWDPDARGVFIGMTYATTQAHMWRAVMEGVAFSLEHNIETARAAQAFPLKLISVGGAANSNVWTQIKSDVCALPIDVPDARKATALGAAMLAGVAAGIYSSYEEIIKSAVKITRSHAPNAAHTTVYKRIFGRYKELYRRLKGF